MQVSECVWERETRGGREGRGIYREQGALELGAGSGIIRNARGARQGGSAPGHHTVLASGEDADRHRLESTRACRETALVGRAA